MKKTCIRIGKAAGSSLPLSQAVKVEHIGGLVFTSGIMAMDPKNPDKLYLDGDIKGQTEQALLQLQEILEAAGTSFDNVIKVNIFLTNIRRDYDGMNEVYAKFFTDAKPARRTVEAAFTVDTLIEIDMVAVV